jgi:hypothetical protein
VPRSFSPYVRFDLNDYSIPHSHVHRTLTLLADLEEVRILDSHNLIARHVRSYGKGAQVEDRTHIAALIAHKHAARPSARHQPPRCTEPGPSNEADPEFPAKHVF